MTPPERLQDVTLAERLRSDLHWIASECETPDGDGVTVNVQLWAERWVARLDAEAAAALSVRGWQDIASAPKGEALLFHPATKGRMPLQPIMRVGWAGEWSNRPATHWMPLPEPPATPPSEG